MHSIINYYLKYIHIELFVPLWPYGRIEEQVRSSPTGKKNMYISAGKSSTDRKYYGKN